MRHRKKRALIIALLLFLIVSFFSLLLGSRQLTVYELIDGLFNQDATYYFILHEYRLPRLIVGALVGASLSVAGVIFQGILRNPLASTDVLGVTKGAGFMAALVMVVPLSFQFQVSVAALIGGIFTAFLLFLFSRKSGFKNTQMIVIGIAISALFDAGIQYLTLTSNGNIHTALVWLVGSLFGRYWDEVFMLLPFILVFLPLSFLLARQIDVLNLGDEVATSLGESVQKKKILLLLIAVVLTAVSVSAAGTIGFIGLLGPHISKSLVGHLHKWLIPMSALMGAILIVVADTIGRVLFAPLEIPVGIVTAIVGAPYFLFLLLGRNKLRKKGLR